MKSQADADKNEEFQTKLISKAERISEPKPLILTSTFMELPGSTLNADGTKLSMIADCAAEAQNKDAAASANAEASFFMMYL